MSFANYYDQLAAMPEQIRLIAEEIWDMTGRPAVDHPLLMADVKLLDLSNTFEEFKQNCISLYGLDHTNKRIVGHELQDRWYTYMGGMKRLANDFSKRNG